MAAASAAIDVTTQRSRTAMRDGAHHFELLIADPGLVMIDEAVAFGAEYVGHLKDGPIHRSCRSLRLMSAGLRTARPSPGLVAACRWRRDMGQETVGGSRSACPTSIWMVRRSAPFSRR